ncbi:MAG: NADH-quinone oxidoreductase subunit L [Vampirovibrionales bacterium]
MQAFFDFLSHTPWLIALYPLLAFVAIVLGRWFQTAGQPSPSDEGHPMLWSRNLVLGATSLGLLHTLVLVGLGFAQYQGHFPATEQNWVWLSLGQLTLHMGTLLDNTGLMMLLVVTGISLLIQIYTHGYMRHDAGYSKFYGYLALFNFAMLGLVLSSNLPQTYIFWELVGLASYLLVGFWSSRPAASAAALKAFVVNRVGDMGLLVGMLMIGVLSMGFWGQYLQQQPDGAFLSFQGLSLFAGYVHHAADQLPAWLLPLVGILLFMGPVAKSAQFPLHTWLPDAMEGPTPISALIHAATMVAAGVFLVARLYPVLGLSDVTMAVITAVGVVTAIMGATMALVQNDIKKALAYSTMSQLGYMMAAMGLGAFSAGLFHLLTHAFFKAMLFLGAGQVIHALHGEQDMRHMGGLWNKIPVTARTYLVGTLAISGLGFTSGFWSKDAILLKAFEVSPIAFYALLAVAGLTAFYMFRTFFMTFGGSYRGHHEVHYEEAVMTRPLVVLAVPSVIAGVALAGVIPQLPSFDSLVFDVSHATHGHGHTLWQAISNPVAILSTLVGLLGFTIAYGAYQAKVLNLGCVARMFAPLTTLFQQKWYMDEIYQGVVENGVGTLAQAGNVADTVLLQGGMNQSAKAVRGLGGVLQALHNGRIQTYVLSITFGVALLCLGAWLLHGKV